MGKVRDSIEPELAEWIAEQRLFFVATAPLGADGHVNASPKGLDTFRVLGPREVAFLDLTGSGAETIAHVRENGRITFVFAALDGAPRIVRLYGRGRVVTPGAAEWPDAVARFPEHPGARSIVRAEVTRVADSCGFGVPRFTHAGDRTTLTDWAVRKGPEGTAAYRREKNARSIDGLPALDAGAGADGPAD
ncbi:MAG: pyridoxamine 5'-phosphate oxidase family protein [Planctomycetota bacterium JB042]